MQDRPTVDELLDAVQGFLRDEVVPRLDGQPAFHARVAANALAIVRRELSQDEPLAEAECERLRELTGAEGSREALNATLVALIDSGEKDTDGQILDHLRTTAAEKLCVSNPRYLPETQNGG